MKDARYIIAGEHGINAMLASQIVKYIVRFSCKVTISMRDATIDAKSIMGVLSLSAKKGDEIRIACDGFGEEDSLSKIMLYFAENI